jgi:hypothetical protein
VLHYANGLPDLDVDAVETSLINKWGI